MRLTLVILSMAIAASVAAQGVELNRSPVPLARGPGGGLGNPAVRLREPECLINKKSHRTVCKSRSGWRKEAAALAAHHS